MTPQFWGSICYWRTAYSAADRRLSKRHGLTWLLFAFSGRLPEHVDRSDLDEAVREITRLACALPDRNPGETLSDWLGRLRIPDRTLTDKRFVVCLLQLRLRLQAPDPEQEEGESTKT